MKISRFKEKKIKKTSVKKNKRKKSINLKKNKRVWKKNENIKVQK